MGTCIIFCKCHTQRMLLWLGVAARCGSKLWLQMGEYIVAVRKSFPTITEQMKSGSNAREAEQAQRLRPDNLHPQPDPSLKGG